MSQNFPDRPEWHLQQAEDLIAFFGRASVNPGGGFFSLDGAGNPIPEAPRELFATCRMIHCFAAASILGTNGAEAIVDHGMAYLTTAHQDPENGGYFWACDEDGATVDTKMAYGHAFVLLAAASAGAIGHAGAWGLHSNVMEALLLRFWDPEVGAMREEFTRDWTAFSNYRGQNSNMHMVEALMAAFETWNEARCLVMAEQIADLIINRHARAAGWVVIEHFDAQWQPNRDYEDDPMFRPGGTTPGHALEWARLCVQLWYLGGRRLEWLMEAATGLFAQATQTAWAEEGGFVYTLDFDNKVTISDRFWWPSCEGAAAASSLFKTTGDPFYAEWYARIWTVLEREFIDHEQGGWWPEAGQKSSVFQGKPDIYHALQACLLPLLSPRQSLLPGLKARL